MRPKREIGDEELLRKRLKSLEDYFSLKDTCDECGAKITEKSKDDDRAVVVLAVEWLGVSPRLLRKKTVCDLCVAELSSFELDNPLNRAAVTLPPEVRRQAVEETEETKRREELLARKNKALAERREALVVLLTGTTSGKQHDKITQNIREIDDELKVFWEGGLRECGLPPPGRHRQEVQIGTTEEVSGDNEATSEKRTRQDLRTRVRSFLRSPYAGKLPAALHSTANLYAVGFDETEIAKRLKISQPKVSRQVQAIKNVVSRRH